jgi:uncharacterized protein YggL (DUF469 family)
MNRRLRKKLRRGEFRELAFPVYFETPDVDQAAFWDAWIDTIEALNLRCSGGGKAETWEFVVSAPNDSCIVSGEAQVIYWLHHQPSVKSIRIGRIFDLWYGPFPAFDGPVLLRARPGR